MPQITFLAIIAAIIAFFVTKPTRALTPEEQAVQQQINTDVAAAVAAGSVDQAAPPMTMDDAKLISEKTRLIKQENERRKQIMDDAGG